jgi:hypothetical protein
MDCAPPSAAKRWTRLTATFIAVMGTNSHSAAT